MIIFDYFFHFYFFFEKWWFFVIFLIFCYFFDFLLFLKKIRFSLKFIHFWEIFLGKTDQILFIFGQKSIHLQPNSGVFYRFDWSRMIKFWKINDTIFRTKAQFIYSSKYTHFKKFSSVKNFLPKKKIWFFWH